MRRPVHPVIPTTSIGAIARCVLDGSQDGEVLAVFRRSFYVKFGEKLVCVGPAELEPGPFNLLYVHGGEFPWSDRLAAGVDASCRPTLLRIGSLCSFEFSDAALWQPAAPGQIDPVAMGRGLTALAGAMKNHTPGGIGPLIVPILAGASRPPHDALGVYSAIQQLQKILLDLDRHHNEVAAIVSQLIGLGPGLTPSGDDMLSGLMAALHIFGYRHAAAQLAALVLPAAKNSTSIISNAHLHAAAGGRLAAPLWDAVVSIAAGGAGLAETLQRVAKLGHSSGWDTLTGAVLAAMAVSGIRRGGEPAR